MGDPDGELGRLGGPVGEAGGEVADPAGHGLGVVARDVGRAAATSRCGPGDRRTPAKNGTAAASSTVMPGTCSARAAALLTMSTRSPAT
jgi:hypothetical protein